MWLQTTYGFYSVIEHRDDIDTLMVRARSRDDLVALCDEVAAGIRRDYNKGDAEGFDTESIVYTPDADYAYRLVVPRKAWMEVSLRLMADIDYPNFKNAVSERDPERANLYHDLWLSLLSIQKPLSLSPLDRWFDEEDPEEKALREYLDSEPR